MARGKQRAGAPIGHERAQPDASNAREGTRGNAKGTRKEHDWPALRRAFVTGDTDDLTAFAKTHGAPRARVAERASREGWRAERAAHRARVDAGVAERLVRQQIAAESEIDGRAHRIALRLLEKFDALLDAAEDASAAKAIAQGLAETWKTARQTAHLAAEPVAAPVAKDDGDLVIKRRAPDGSPVEVTSAAPANDR